MHILPKALRIALVNEFGNNVSSVIPVFSQDSKQAQKLLFELTDGERIEAVGTGVGIFLHLFPMWMWLWMSFLCNGKYGI